MVLSDRFGSMAAALKAEQRQLRSETLKVKLWEAVVEPDGGVYLARTGSLLKGRDLRGKANRKIFDHIRTAFPQHENDVCRFWTKRLLSDSIDSLIRDYKLILPQLPGFKYDDWLRDQACLFQALAKKSRRNRNRSSGSNKAMDDQGPTLAYDGEDSSALNGGDWSPSFPVHSS